MRQKIREVNSLITLYIKLAIALIIHCVYCNTHVNSNHTVTR